MLQFLEIIVFVIFLKFSTHGFPDLTPEAITVYRNPDFFRNLSYGDEINYEQSSTEVPEETQGNYKYPGETKKPNPPASSGFEVNYDNSPEFHHEPRDVFVDTTYKPSKRKGPYKPKYHKDESFRSASSRQTQTQERDNVEGSKESKENVENDSGERRDFLSVFNESPNEEFKSYHEPTLLTQQNFDSVENSDFASSKNRLYSYNKTHPIRYEDWKFYTYPKIHANEHLNSDSKLYSEEPPSNSFEDESPSYGGYDDDDRSEDASNIFESEEFKNLGADTKHIYKKLLKPKKSFLFKFHSKPKFKKLKLNLKKKHFHKSDWFDEYPFDF